MKQSLGYAPDIDPVYLRQLFKSGERKDFLDAVRLALRQVLANLYVEDNYDQVITQIKREPCYQDLNNNWDKLEPAARGQKWQALMERLLKLVYATRPYCVRCGECCLRGSPSLHLEDAELLERGLISARQLYTLRRGEMVSLNIDRGIGVLPEELVKIKEDSETGYCLFYSKEQHSCLVYDHRPLQCRVQACWNPENSENIWRQEKLTRRAILTDEDVLEILEVYDERCDPEKLDAAFKQVYETRDAKTLDRVLEILRQDVIIRAFVKTRLNRAEEELNFLLGRPLTDLVRAYGMRVEKDADGTYRLVPDHQTSDT